MNEEAMAKRQSRRTVSLNRQIHDAARDHAHARGTSFSQFAEAALQAAMARTPAAGMMPPGAIEWLLSGERGVSSESIFAHLTGIPIAGRVATNYLPSDAGDLRRCRKLLEVVPSFR